ncbi:hypothetical protein CUMW_119520 [Citrus unshiu]|nr:hypothetical protein CUMW_119520 [Citrus unshiu]
MKALTSNATINRNRARFEELNGLLFDNGMDLVGEMSSRPKDCMSRFIDAAILSGEGNEKGSDLVLLDVTLSARTLGLCGCSVVMKLLEVRTVIIHDKGRLSKEDNENGARGESTRKDEDGKKKVEANESLENYAYT